MKSLSLQLSMQQLSRHDGWMLRAQRSFPQTDYYYQAKAEAPATVSSARRPVPANYAAQMRSFRQLSNTVAGAEARWQFAMEASVLGLITAVVAWPLISLLIVLVQTARG